MIYSEKLLSQKLERTEARANADYVETRARLFPNSGATWIEVAGAYAMFDGVESPITQTFGLGVFENVTNECLDRLEAFFKERGAPVFHEVSPMADPSILTLLNERGYHPIELTSVMCRGLSAVEFENKTGDPEIVTRVIVPGEADVWARTAAAGWATEQEGLAEFIFDFGQIGAQCSGASPYLAEIDGTPIAAAMLLIYENVCILGGASTVPAARNRGAQNALLAARMKFAVAKGCNLAIMGALPGSQSQRNAQKNGFDIAYTRIKWQLKDET